MFNKDNMMRPLIALALLIAMAAGMFVVGGPEAFRAKAKSEDFAAGEKEGEVSASSPGGMGVYFEENKGQFDEKVRYYARGTNGYSLFLTATDAVYVVHEKTSEGPRGGSEEGNASAEAKKGPKYATAVYMSLAGANPMAETSGADQQPHLTNYFRGEESNWRTGIRNFGTISTSGIYEGIDMVWQGGESGGVRYDFIVKPDADPNQIVWELKGASGAKLTPDGTLLIKTAHGEIRQNKPFTYQEAGGKDRR